MTQSETVGADSRDSQDLFWRRTRTVAFWSVVIGIVLELALLGVAAASSRAPEFARTVAQVASKVSWSFVVCFGISCGLAAGQARSALMGILGAISGPAGFAVARSVHKGVGQALSMSAGAVDPSSPLALAGIKAIEYAIFGFWLARITKHAAAPLSRHLGAGAVIGLVFSAIFVFVFQRAKPDATAIELVSKSLNEFVFPIGCAFVLFVANRTTAAARKSDAKAGA